MRGALVVMERGKDRCVRADEVIADAHRPSEGDVRVTFREHLNIRPADFGGVHIELREVRELVEEGTECIVIGNDKVAEVERFNGCIDRERHEGGCAGFRKSKGAQEKDGQEEEKNFLHG